MRLGRILLVVALWTLGSSAAVAAEQRVNWMTRIDDGQRVAAEAKKDLLISFTGHGWCHYCELLDRAVFRQDEFAQSAPKTFVLVEIDFAAETGEDTDTSKAKLRTLYAAWKKEYLIHGVPVVVLADAAGKPYAYFSYYDGITADKFVAASRKAQAARVERDRYLAEAKAATSDVARAEKLHLALQAICTSLGTKEERGADPLLTFYADLVAEIQRLDAGDGAKIRAIYERRIAARDAWVRSEEIFAELEKFKPNQDHAGAIAYLDVVIPTVTDRAMLRRLEHARQVYLEWDHRYDAALANVRRLMQTEEKTSSEYVWYQRREAFNLVNLDRWDEYLDVWSRRFDNAADRPAARRKLLEERSQLLFKRADVKRSIAAAQELRQAVPLFSDDWQTASMFLATELNRDRRYKFSIQVWRELIAFWRLTDEDIGAHAFLAVAEAQFADGQLGEALRSVAAAEEALAKTIDEAKTNDFQRQRMVNLKETIRRAIESKS